MSKSVLLKVLVIATLKFARATFLPHLIPNLEDYIPLTLEEPPSYPIKDGDSFDYIVVGAGAAGCAVAARLALAGQDVLLIEAGGDAGLLSAIPFAASGLLGSPIDWQYKTIPNNVSCLSSIDQQCRFSRGKCLGGSTSINYMLYVRGNRHDFDFNITGWTWKDLEPYFFRYEGLQDLDQLPPSSIPYHNTSGILKTQFFADPKNPWHERLIEGLQSLNFPLNADVNAESQIGVTKSIGYVYKGERMSTARAYLTNSEVKKRLKLVKDTKCTGVSVTNENLADGVTVQALKGPMRLNARREVILSAGAIGTPQLLMLSGIGPAEHLESLGLNVRANLSVGDDMSDHVLPLIFILVDRNLLSEVPDLAGTIAEAVEYGATRDGPFASNGLTDILGFANTYCYDTKSRKLTNNRTECEFPTLQLISAHIDRGLLSIGHGLIPQMIGLNIDIAMQLGEVNSKYAIIIASPVVLQPYSRGTVRLVSTDPLDNPAIYPNFLGDQRDVEEILRAVRILEDLVDTPIFKKHNASILHLKLKCPSYVKDWRGYWECYVRHLTYSVFHSVGTAALGRVVDSRLRVRGVAGLRVADLSVLPQVPRGNTAASAIAIGERAADFVMEDNTIQTSPPTVTAFDKIAKIVKLFFETFKSFM